MALFMRDERREIFVEEYKLLEEVKQCAKALLAEKGLSNTYDRGPQLLQVKENLRYAISRHDDWVEENG
jgi:hypothetical protein